MLFSVVVPVYNAEKYLVQCIESIVNQNFKEFDLILVNDGSTDGSGQICDKFAEKYDNIRVIHKKNEGQVKARIDGVNAAKGEYILFGDADDWFEEGALQKVDEIVKKDNPELILFGFQYVETGKYTKSSHSFEERLYVNEEKKVLYTQMICDSERIFTELSIFPAVWCRVIKRELLIEWQGKVDAKLKVGEDLVLLTYCMLNASSVYVCHKNLYNYRVLGDSLSHKYSEGMFQNLCLIKDELEKVCTNCNRECVVQVRAYVLKELWNCVVKVCRHKTKREVIHMLKSDFDVRELCAYVKTVNTCKVDLKMRMALVLLKYQKWKMLYYLINIYFCKR